MIRKFFIHMVSGEVIRLEKSWSVNKVKRFMKAGVVNSFSGDSLVVDWSKVVYVEVVK